ncbi:MAG TPA: cache domain-containing protein [Syntrophales bacterium]|nr:cache domain-containing protein [Syntrophales bacterium]HOL58604.1 cache domain-containing protein [Syntrophales bacterium]HPO34788.1 cache domain-containing protein [Syntrophales bacterium]
MKTRVFWVLVLSVLFSLAFSLPLLAQEKMATPEQAKELYAQIIKYVKSVGCEQAIEELKKGKFYIYKNAYPSVSDEEGVNLFNAKYPYLAGKKLIDLKDATGKYFIREAREQIEKKGKAVVHYKWMDPQTKKVESRTMLVEPVKCSDGRMIRYAVTYEGSM